MMLRVYSLRFGNIVQYRDKGPRAIAEVGRFLTSELQNVSGDPNGVVFIGEPETAIRMEAISAIKLSAQWLEKFGFQFHKIEKKEGFDHEGLFVHDDARSLGFAYNMDYEVFECWALDSSLTPVIMLTHIDAVHHFQNTVNDICNIELSARLLDLDKLNQEDVEKSSNDRGEDSPGNVEGSPEEGTRTGGRSEAD